MARTYGGPATRERDGIFQRDGDGFFQFKYRDVSHIDLLLIIEEEFWRVSLDLTSNYRCQ